MRPLTDTCPKPLLPVRGRPLRTTAPPHNCTAAETGSAAEERFVPVTWTGTSASVQAYGARPWRRLRTEVENVIASGAESARAISGARDITREELIPL